jgi:formate hydrogenlyase subunit 3/multisubunit Na+/H+ antiporter MnhD subunit
MPEELLYWQQLLRGSGEGWFEVTLLASLFLVLIFRPERIENRALFRAACLLFALAIIAPPALRLGVSLLAGSLQSVYQPYRSMPIESPIVLSLLGVVKPALLGASVLCGLLSLFPGKPQPRAEPARHPLE